MSLASLTVRCLLTREFMGRPRLKLCLVSSAGIKTKQEEPELPKIPKKPFTPYIQFTLHHRDDVRKKHPMLTNKELQNELLNMWHSLTFHEKNLWSLRYQREKAEYDMKYKESIQKLDALPGSQTLTVRVKKKVKPRLNPEEDWETVKRRLFEEKQKNAKKQECESLGKPRFPGTAFSLYLISKKQEEPQSKNTLHEKSVMWNNLPEKEKEIFLQKARALQEQYRADLIQWETKMCEMGRYDLVRWLQRKRLRQRLKGS